MVISRNISTSGLLATVLAVFGLLLPASAPAAKSAAPFVGETFEDIKCTGDSVGNGSGPYDYMQRARLQKQLRLTEIHHFTPQVEMLLRGQSSAKPITDIIFTLTYWPNHHRALNSLSLYNRRAKAKGLRLNPPAECWLQRAVNFNAQDATARMLYAIYLHRSGYDERARKEYLIARQQAPQDMSIAYNYGLLLVDLEDFDQAKQLAKTVYSNGFPLPGLRRKLEEKGYSVP